MVVHRKLLEDILSSSLPGAVIRWLSCYLKGRQSHVSYRNTISKTRNVRAGVPQGAVLSPKLFNFYVSGMPKPPPGVNLTSYADDTSIHANGPLIQPLVDAINSYTPRLVEFFDERGLVVSPEKSTVTRFTPQSTQARIHPGIIINGTDVPLDTNPKVLGVIHDKMYCFTTHCRAAATKVRLRNNVLKAIAGTAWGCDCETILMT
jgi:hypothetical protein